MKILISNDDGINAIGIYELTKALSEVAEVYVCAPHQQRSAASHSISFRDPIRVRRTEFDNAVMALETTGTPADCVKLGLKVLGDIGIEIDMVFSGINLGGNMGTDTLYSGTVAAAIEGSVCGKPSVAVSVNSHNAAHFEYACRLAARCAQNACGKLLPGTVLNINVPDLPDAEIKGTRITTLGKRNYEPWFVLESGQEHDADNIDLCYRYGGNPINYDMEDENADVAAVDEGYASITPLMHNLTARDMVEEIKKWRLI